MSTKSNPIILGASTLKPVKVESLDWNSEAIGSDVNDRFDVINQNFKSILQSEYLKGPKGDNIITKKYSLEDNDKLELLDKFTKLIYTGKDDNISQNIKNQLKDQKILLIYSVDSSTEPEQKMIQSCIPFVFKDNREPDVLKPQNFNDLSCIIYYDYMEPDPDQKWKSIQTIPTLYYDEQKKNFCWKVNNVETGLIAMGPTGKDGEPGASPLFAKGEIQESDKQVIKISHFYFQETNNKSGEWIEAKNITQKIKPAENNLIFILVENKTSNQPDNIYIGNLVELSNNGESEYWVTNPSLIGDLLIRDSYCTIEELNDVKDNLAGVQTNLNTVQTNLTDLNNTKLTINETTTNESGIGNKLSLQLKNNSLHVFGSLNPDNLDNSGLYGEVYIGLPDPNQFQSFSLKEIEHPYKDKNWLEQFYGSVNEANKENNSQGSVNVFKSKLVMNIDVDRGLTLHFGNINIFKTKSGFILSDFEYDDDVYLQFNKDGFDNIGNGIYEIDFTGYYYNYSNDTIGNTNTEENSEKIVWLVDIHYTDISN